tara:strand:- start:7423 stop:7707 length:285 start_codon:yes stop_codon:yes gene_type:complete
MSLHEQHLEEALINRLVELKYEHRPDIHDRSSLEANFREKFDSLNRVKLTNGEFGRLLDEILEANAFDTAVRLWERSGFVREGYQTETLHGTGR